MVIFATEFTVLNHSYHKKLTLILLWILVVALREGYPECFSHLSFSLIQ